MPGLARMLGWMLAMSLALSGAIGVMSSGGRWPQLAINGGVAWLYSIAIGGPAMLAFRRIRPRLEVRAGLRPWLVYLGVMVVALIGGTFAVRGGLTLAGAMTVRQMWDGLWLSLQVSVAIALPMTVGAATYSRLQRQISESELAASEARLASLESRIRPHFLFNALNSAAALIPADPQRAEDVLVRLGALLRSSLDRGASVVTLADELQVVVDYLEIERSRFGDRLAYEIDVPDEARALQVPAFAVQTLVENCVKHAVSAREAGATIAVRGRRQRDRLQIEVRDDGPGFGDTPWLAGHGLDGLRHRLDVLYGDAATLAVAPGAAAGATVTLDVPGAP